jgi:8-oxo-dGTP pyrophosphatase MutT (NUDIX family)
LKNQLIISDFTLCVAFLKQRLSMPLPGEEAQFKLAPSYRGKTDILKLTNYKAGSVLMLIFSVLNEPHLLFIERADDGKVHSGQVAFPGGKKDATDSGDSATALRETEEETGILQSSIEIIGALTQLYIPPSNFLVSPFVGFLNGEPQLNLSAVEVKRTIAVPLKEFFNENAISMEATHQTIRGNITAPAYVVQDIKIWGATSMILSEFLALFDL